MYKEALSLAASALLVLVAITLWQVSRPFPRVCPHGAFPSINREGCWTCAGPFFTECEATMSVRIYAGEYEISSWLFNAIFCSILAVIACAAGVIAEE